MNFRQGFFRIWVILSILFIIAVAIVSHKEVSGEFEKASLDFSSVGIPMVPVDCKEARGTSGIDYDPPERPWNAYAKTPNCWYKMPIFRRLFPEYKDLADADVTDKLYAQASIELRRARPWQALGIAATIALGVPLVILVFGVALGWALSGFRTKPT